MVQWETLRSVPQSWHACTQVVVHNDLPSSYPMNSNGISIHWHGLSLQSPDHSSQWYDGVPYVHQCPIAAGSSFTYRFRVSDPPGESYAEAPTRDPSVQALPFRRDKTRLLDYSYSNYWSPNEQWRLLVWRLDSIHCGEVILSGVQGPTFGTTTRPRSVPTACPARLSSCLLLASLRRGHPCTMLKRLFTCKTGSTLRALCRHSASIGARIHIAVPSINYFAERTLEGHAQAGSSIRCPG